MYSNLKALIPIILSIPTLSHAALSSRTQLDRWATDICNEYKDSGRMFCITVREFVTCSGTPPILPQTAAKVTDGQACCLGDGGNPDEFMTSTDSDGKTYTYDEMYPKPYSRYVWPDDSICQPSPTEYNGTVHHQDGCKKWWDEVKDGDIQGHWS